MSAFGDGSGYLNYLAKTGQGFIHPGGMAATAWMAEMLELEATDRVLEVGCGTGASMATLLSNDRIAAVMGVETNPLMARAARRRLSTICQGLNWRVEEAELAQLQSKGELFDKIYCESVLCLQSEAKLREMAANIFAMLKPGGLFAAVETIWQEGTSKTQVDAQNQAGQAAFGVTMSTPMAWHLSDWSELFRGTGFDIQSDGLLPNHAQLSQAVSPGWSLPRLSFSQTIGKKLRNLWHYPEERRFRRRLKAFENQPRLGETRCFLLKK